MNLIVGDIYFDSCQEIKDSATNCYSTDEIDAESILRSIEEVKMQCGLSPVVIYIWRGSSFYKVFEDKLKPELRCSEHIRDDDAAYIVAGYGIVAGKKAFKFLSDNNFELRWSDEYVPLEEQKCYHLLQLYTEEN